MSLYLWSAIHSGFDCSKFKALAGLHFWWLWGRICFIALSSLWMLLTFFGSWLSFIFKSVTVYLIWHHSDSPASFFNLSQCCDYLKHRQSTKVSIALCYLISILVHLPPEILLAILHRKSHTFYSRYLSMGVCLERQCSVFHSRLTNC